MCVLSVHTGVTIVDISTIYEDDDVSRDNGYSVTIYIVTVI